MASDTHFPNIASSTTELLLVNKKDLSVGSFKTFKPQPSSVLAQVKDFLPRLAVANQHLKEVVDSGRNIDIEHVEDGDGPLIQMDLALVEQDSDSEYSDSSDESIQGEITEDNLKLKPKCKRKPNIEMIDSSEADTEICDKTDNKDGSVNVR